MRQSTLAGAGWQPTRRSVLGLGFGAAVFGSGMAGAAAPISPPKVLRVATSSNRASQTEVVAQAFSKAVSERTNGRIRVESYFGGSLGSEKVLAEEVAGGSLDFAVVASPGYAAPALAPALSVFDVPFLFRDVAHARAVLDGPIGAAKLKMLAGNGAVGLAWCENGLRQLTTANKAVRTPADLAGIKIRVPQSEVLAATFQALGAQPTPLPFPDVFAALATGTLEAQENPLAIIRSTNFDRVQKYLCLTSHAYLPAMVMASEATMALLAPDDREAMVAAAREAGVAARRISDEQQDNDLKDLQSKGMTLVADVDREAFVKAVASIEPKFDAMFGAELLSSIRNYGR